MNKLVGILSGIVAADKALLQKATDWSRLATYFSAVAMWYFIALTALMFYSYLSLSFVPIFAAGLTVSFSVPIYFFYLSNIIFFNNDRLNSKNWNSLLGTRMIQTVLLTLLFYSVSKAWDIVYIRYYSDMDIRTTEDALTELFNLNMSTVSVQIISGVHVLLFFTPILIKSFSWKKSQYNALNKAAEKAIIDKEMDVYEVVITSTYQGIYQKYKGKKKYQPHHNEKSYVFRNEKTTERTGLNHSGFLHALRQKNEY